MGPELALTKPENLQLYKLDRSLWMQERKPVPETPNGWFGQRYPQQFEKFGSPFIELVEPMDQFTTQVLPISVNVDFFAGMLGGRKDLDHHVVYFEPEMQFYYREPIEQLYKSTSPEKLANLYRALLMKCAQDMPPNVHKLNLFHEFRSDKTAKAVVQRAKSILAADHTFFSATSIHQRIKGPELYERLARVFVESMLEPKEGACLTVTQAYNIFCKLSLERNLGQLKRSDFKEMMRDFIKDKYGMSLRHDVPDFENKHQQAWKGLKVIEAEVGSA